MARKRGKSVSFDAMVKFFMRNYDIPTKKDVDMLAERLERIENLIRLSSGANAKAVNKRTAKGKTALGKTTVTASDQVIEVVKRFKLGVSFTDIQSRTGFGDKKLRNIIFRLNKLGRIQRKSRGIYIAV